MAHIIPSNVRDLIITFVKSDGILLKFWGLPVTSLDIVSKFEAQFAKDGFDLEHTSGYLNSNQTPVGFRCAALSKYKNQWCRARVLHVRGYNELLVQLLDYGNEEVVSVADIRFLDESYFRLPPQALECILGDVVPANYTSEWSPDAIRFCEQHLVCQTVSCIVISTHVRRGGIGEVIEKVPIVRIAKKGEKDPFVQRLINSGLAFIKPEAPPPPQVQQPQPVPIQPLPTYKMNMLDPNTTHLVRISFVESLQKFYIQLAAAELELNKLTEQINNHPQMEGMPLMHAPAINAPCLAQFSGKPLFYRAVIRGISDGRCSVLFVDYGCSEVKHFGELRALPSRFLGLQAQAICCSLKPGDISSEMCLKNVGMGELYNCHVLGINSESFVVRLTPHEADIQKRHRPTPTVTPPLPLFYRRQALDVGKIYDVTVSFINDVSDFYCQLNLFKDHLDRLTNQLTQGDYFDPISLQECQPQTPVCVKYSEDNQWYRAQVVRVNHERDIEVFFVDFGNYDNASLQSIRKLKPDLMQLTVQAFKCCLFETDSPIDPNLKDDMFTFFEELATSTALKAQVRAVTDGQCYVMTLQEPNSPISINEKIQSKFTGIGSIPVSDTENLCVTSFTSPSLFFAQFTKISDDKLNTMQEQINEFYLTQRNMSFRPAVGSYVCARYAEDGQFYRARVESINNMQCHVFFIDYGNREVVALQELHPMQKEFILNPQFGIECGLESCPPATPVEKLKILMDGAFIQARMLREDTENKKWIVSLTEEFPKNVAILELLRQHEMLVPRSIHGAGLQGYQANSVVQNSNRPVAITGRNANERMNDSQPTNLSLESMSIPANACRNVFVSFVVSPSEFYVQIEEESSKLDALMKQIEDNYTNNNLDEARMAVDAPCCAMFEDEIWYRGQIKQVGANECSVYFVDYGNTDSVPTSKVKALQRQFFSLPQQAVRCKSHNVSPKSGRWSDGEIDTFSDMTLEKSFVAQFLSCDGGFYSVNLVSPSKLQEDILNKEFQSRLQGATTAQQPNPEPVYSPPRRQPELTYLQKQEYPQKQRQQEYQAPVQPKPKRPTHEAAPSNLRLPPPRVRVGSRENVIVPFGLSPYEVFCQLGSMEKEFSDMMVRLQTYYHSLPPNEGLISNAQVNMVCVAMYREDKAWYRAEIKKASPGSLAIYFVDYGNSAVCSLNEVRSITQEFTSLPMQAIKCHLKGILPQGESFTQSEAVANYFIGDSQCHFIEKNGDHFLVDIFCNDKSVAQLLVNDGIAMSDAPAVVAKQATLPAPSKPSQPIPQRQDKFLPGQLLSLHVSFSEGPSRFWCQLLDESDTLDQLTADIEVQYMESENLPIDARDLVPGYHCMAQYSADGAWYRVQIKKIVSAQEYEVYFVDYGNAEVASINKLASMHQEFLSVPPQCFTCRLARAPSSSNDTMIQTFTTVTSEIEELTGKVEGTAGGVCVLTLLYEKGSEEINLNDQLFGVAPPVEVSKFLSPDIPLGPKEGYVTEVITPREFFIQLAGIEDALSDLSTKLSEECEELALLQDPVIGSACAAKYSEDNNWYRAEVIGLQDTTADVLFVDYGNSSTVPKDTLRVLSQSFLDTPPYSIQCKLNGIIPPSQGDQWPDNSINTFNEMVLDSELIITFISKDIPATVNIAKDDKDIAQALVDLEMASVETCTEEAYADDHLTAVEDNLHSLPTDLSYPKRKLTSKKLLVKICYVESCGKFYCMPSELGTELDTVMKTLEILYSPSVEDKASPSLLSPLEDPAVSMACVAKYSEDESWYRAIVSRIDGENISVDFVDYGNTELTTLDNLRPITPELMKIPPIAIECHLYGVKVAEGKEQGIGEKLENFCLEETELEMEVVVLSGAVYSVRLCDADGDLASSLVKEGLAVVSTPPPETEDEILVENMNENLKTAFVEDSKYTISLRSVSLDEDLLVDVKHCEIVNEMAFFYGVPNDLEDSLAKFQDDLQVAYDGIEGRVESIACHDFCVAKYVEDELWYRAQVVSLEDNKIKVKFIDYGNTEVVSKDSLSKLLPEFQNEPQFSIAFCLSGCKVRQEKHKELQDKMEEYFYEGPALVKMCKYSHSYPAICCIDVVCGGNNIVELFLQEKLLMHQFTINPQLIKGFEATVEIIVDKLLYVLPVQLKGDRDDLQSRLKTIYDAGSPVENADPGRLYVANVEEKVYRVALLDSSNGSALINCLDFGLDAEVEDSKLRLLPEDLCHYPLLLQPCSIVNVEEAPDVITKQDMKELEGQVFQWEVLNTPPLQFPLETKIVNRDSAVQVPSQLELDVLKTIEDDLQNYSDMVTDIETDSEVVNKMISSVEIAKAEDDKDVVVAGGTCEVIGNIDEANFEISINGEKLEELIVKERAYVCGEDEIEEPIVKESTYVCGDDKELPEEDNLDKVLKETDSFVEEMKNLAISMEKAASEFVKENKFESNALSVESQIVQNGLQESEAPEDLEDTYVDSSEASPQVDDGALSQTEDELKETELESQFPESEAASCLTKTDNDTNVIEAEESEDQLTECDKLEGAFDTEKCENDNLNNTEFAESDKVEGLDYVETTESDNLVNHDNTEFAESDNLVTHDNTGFAESDKVEGLDYVETESDNLGNQDSTEFAESDTVEGLENMETTESDNLDNYDNTEFTESDKIKEVGNVETTESDNLDNDENTEIAESDKVGSVGNSESERENLDNIESVESDKLGVATTGPTEDSNHANFENLPEAKCDNEWDERPECDIKPENALNGTDSENVQAQKEKNATSDCLLRSLVGTSWHKSLGKLKASVTDVTIQENNIVVKIQPSSDELGFLLFSTHKEAYIEKSNDISGLTISSLCAVDMNGTNWCLNWHRGKIVDIKEDAITVSLIDSGTQETVPKTAVRDLEATHRAPLVSARCTLATASCIRDKAAAAKEFLDALLKDNGKQTYIQLVDVDSSSDCTINLFLDKIDVLHLLLQEKMAVQTIPPLSVPPGQHTAKLSHFQHGFYVNLASQIESVISLKDSMQGGSYPADVEVPVVENGMYAVKYEDHWMRAQAVASSEQGLALRLIDVGELIPVTTELYPLHSRHCLSPPFAVPCKVHDLDQENNLPGEFLVNVTIEAGVVTASLVDESTKKEDADSKKIFN